MNEKKKIVIVGGVAGGATAAGRARRLDETAEITLIESSGYISFANCGSIFFACSATVSTILSISLVFNDAGI